MADNQFKDRLEEFSYAMGLTISMNLIQSGISKIDSLQFLAGLQDNYAGNKPQMTLDEANRILQEYMLEQNTEEGRKNLEDGIRFLTNNIYNEGVIVTKSGLQYKVLKEGYGKYPGIDDQVKCHYHGVLLDGTVFDSSVERREPVIFPINSVIQGWAEALQRMQEGAKWRLFIPADLAYGEQGAAGLIGPNSVLVFDVELIEIV